MNRHHSPPWRPSSVGAPVVPPRGFLCWLASLTIAAASVAASPARQPARPTGRGGAQPTRSAAGNPDRSRAGNTATPTTAPSAATLSPELQKLLATYRDPKASADDRAKAVDQMLDQGEAGARLAAETVGADFKAKRAAYLKQFEKAAGEVARQGQTPKPAGAKAPAVSPEVAKLRRDVLGLSQTSGRLTEEQIKQYGDPAMKRLTELLPVPKADAVLSSDANLKPQREEALALAMLGQKAVDKLPEAARKKLAAATVLPESGQAETELKADEDLAASLVLPMTAKDRTVMTGNVAEAKKLQPAEAESIFKLNLIRLRLGLNALAIDPKLCEAARTHSKDMKVHNFFDHESPVRGRETPWKRAQQAGTNASGENIFEGNERADVALDGWWHSPGHHVMMLGPHRRVGAGRYETYWTQMFGQ